MGDPRGTRRGADADPVNEAGSRWRVPEAREEFWRQATRATGAAVDYLAFEGATTTSSSRGAAI